MSKTLAAAAGAFILAAAAIPSAANADVVNFDTICNASGNSFYNPSVTVGDYLFQGNLLSWRLGSPNSSDPDGCTLLNNIPNTPITISRVDGQDWLFNGLSIGHGFQNAADPSGRVSFTFNYSAGTSTTQTYQLDTLNGMEEVSYNVMLKSVVIRPVTNNSNTSTIQIDDLRANINATPAVPEPASWAMMIAGFGLIGGVMRSRQRTTVQYAGMA